MAAIGTAVCSPPRPASGAMVPAMTHCRKPSSADPVPGWSGTAAEASAPALGPTRPWAVMRTKKPTSAAPSGIENHTAAAARTSAGDTGGDEADLDEHARRHAVGVPGGDQGGDRHPAGVDGEVDRVLHRCQAVHRLQHVRRGGDVGERGAHREREHHQVAAEHARGQHLTGRAEQTPEATSVASFGRERLGHRRAPPPGASRAARAATTQNDTRQCVTDSTSAPSSGPTIGAIPATAATRFIARTMRAPSVRSTTTDRAMTMAQPPANPCTNRAAIITVADGLNAHATDATTSDHQRSQQRPPASHPVRERAADQLTQRHARRRTSSA